MKIRSILLVLMFLMSCISFSAKAANKEEDYQKSYNYKRAVELLLNDQNESEAMRFFNAEIEDHKDNGYAYYWIALINENNERAGKALDAANKAIKYLAKDSHWQSYTYRLRARVYLMLDDEKSALTDFTKAIKVAPEEPEPYQARGDYYYDHNQYDLADADYMKMIEYAPGDSYGYMALGRNDIAKEKYDDAIDRFNYVMKLDPEYSSAYSFRSEALLKKRSFADSSDDAIKALSLDQRDYKAFGMIQEIADSAFNVLDIKLKTQTKRNPNNTFWLYVWGIACEHTNRYEDAIQHYQAAFETEPDDVSANRMSICYEELNDYASALTYINRAIELDSTYSSYQLRRVQIEEYYGMTDEAYRDIETYIDNFPDDYYGYYKKGWLLDKYQNKIEEAIEAYTTSAALQPEYDYNYLGRGQLYRKQGKEDLAIQDFKEVLKLDTVPSEHGNARQYALLYLGDTIKSVEWMKSLIENDSIEDKKGVHYDAACLYSLIGDCKSSLEHLKKSLDLGWSRFTHARVDDDLKNVRELPEFEEMLRQYETELNLKYRAKAEDKTELIEREAEIPFTREGGVCKVKCTINALPLYFVFDTGASDVSLSNVEAAFMLKNDYLSKSDMSGKGYYINANGDISEGTIVTLKEVNFGGLTLKNVKASIVKNQKAPLLLGQSVLARLGKIEIDNSHKVIRVKYNEKNNKTKNYVVRRRLL